jgi:predicted transcriptional regulator
MSNYLIIYILILTALICFIIISYFQYQKEAAKNTFFNERKLLTSIIVINPLINLLFNKLFIFLGVSKVFITFTEYALIITPSGIILYMMITNIYKDKTNTLATGNQETRGDNSPINNMNAESSGKIDQTFNNFPNQSNNTQNVYNSSNTNDAETVLNKLLVMAQKGKHIVLNSGKDEQKKEDYRTALYDFEISYDTFKLNGKKLLIKSFGDFSHDLDNHINSYCLNSYNHIYSPLGDDFESKMKIKADKLKISEDFICNRSRDIFDHLRYEIIIYENEISEQARSIISQILSSGEVKLWSIYINYPDKKNVNRDLKELCKYGYLEHIIDNNTYEITTKGRRLAESIKLIHEMKL